MPPPPAALLVITPVGTAITRAPAARAASTSRAVSPTRTVRDGTWGRPSRADATAHASRHEIGPSVGPVAERADVEQAGEAGRGQAGGGDRAGVAREHPGGEARPVDGGHGLPGPGQGPGRVAVVAEGRR